MDNPSRTSVDYASGRRRRFPRHFNFVCYNIIWFNNSFSSRGAEDNGAIFALIANLLNFVVLKYQVKDQKSPFDTNPGIILFGVASFIAHCLARDFVPRLSSHGHGLVTTYDSVIQRCMLLFGYLSAASLVSLLYSNAARPAIFLLFFVPSVGDYVMLWIVQSRIWRWVHNFVSHFDERCIKPFFLRLWRLMMKCRIENHRQNILPVWQNRFREHGF